MRLDKPASPPLLQERSDMLHFGGSRFKIRQNVRFPEAKRKPIHRAQRGVLLNIALPISGDFRHPVRTIGASSQPRASALPIPSMPEVAVAKDTQSVLLEDDIRASGQTGHMLEKPQTTPPKRLP